MTRAALFCILCAATALIIPLRWIFAILFAALIHELCHFVFVYMLGGKIRCVRIGLNGAIMECDSLSDSKMILSTLAGPAGGLLIVLLWKWIPYTALCSLIYSSYNLLPVFPLDGGRILEYAIRAIWPIWYRDNLRLLRNIATGLIVCIVIFLAAFFRRPYLIVMLWPICREKYLANHIN